MLSGNDKINKFIIIGNQLIKLKENNVFENIKSPFIK
jgi:hypothetical protein